MTFDKDEEITKSVFLTMCPSCGKHMERGEDVFNIKDLCIGNGDRPCCELCYIRMAPWYEVLVHEHSREILFCLGALAVSCLMFSLTFFRS